MRQTEQNIKEYQKRLPHLREKVASVALFLVISIIMMTSATFAWITVSTKPEVTGIETTVAANGNLEIALSDTDGLEPDASAVGDAKKDLKLRNITWGNLVNLGDESYGLENIILRPAALNVSSLLSSPLYAADYSEDGRVNDLTSSFAYTNYDPDTSMFRVPMATQYGVRAISSVTYTFAGGAEIYVERLQAAQSRLTQAQNKYLLLTSDEDNMTAISKIMGDYLTDKFSDSETGLDFQGYVPQMYSMMQQFDECLDMTGEAIVYIANLQVMLTKGSDGPTYTLETLLAESTANLTANGVNIEGFAEFKSDYNTYATHMTKMESLNKQVANDATPVYWDEIGPIINFLVDINTTVVDGMPVSTIGMDEAASLVFKSDHQAIITKGALWRAEKRLGVKMYAEDLPVDVSYSGMDLTLKADVYTDVTEPYYLPTAVETVKNSNSGNLQGSDPVAAETYGMAIDVWVRSNASNDYLILEGNTVTTKVQKTDDQGNKYFTDQNDNVVIMAADGTYYDANGVEITKSDDGKYYDSNDNELTLSITYEDVVIGYEGENRVWDDEVLNEYSATQGGGSCYVFYADSPAEQAQGLELLASMTVVFIDDTGKLLAYADLATDQYYAESGRVTVPLQLRSTSLQVGEEVRDDGTKVPVYAITSLQQGVAKRITALVYIDGTRVENADVLAENDIEGRLNIQFGSYADLDSIKDQEVFDQEIHITGSVSKNSFDFATDTDFTTKVSLTVTGIEPQSTVKANFIRQINSTQGTRQDTFTLDNTSGEVYEKDVEFTAPGTYVLRSAWIDGVEYELDEPLTVTITGFAIAGVSWEHANNYVKVMSADSATSENITVTFAGSSIVPSKVQAVFSNTENQQLTVSMRKGSDGSWGGTAQFISSGVYTMKYLIIDGEYYEIPASMQKTIDLSLGIKATVVIPGHNVGIFDGSEVVSLPVYVTIADNKGNELTGYEGLSIQYLAQGSGLVENGLYSSLTWNAAYSRYEGNFNLRYAGAYEYGYITMNNSTINSATAPVITAIPPEPPSYYGDLTEESIFAYGADVSMRITLDNSQGIADGNMIAVLQKLDDSGNVVLEIEVAGTKAAHTNTGDEPADAVLTDWLFTIPSTETLETKGYTGVSQLGKWQMKELHIIGAYVDGVISSEEEPYLIDVSDKGIDTTINDDMNVLVTGAGQTLDEPLFLESASVTEGVTVQIKGAGDEEVLNVENVKLTYKWDSSSVSYSSGSTSVGYSATDADKANYTTYGTVEVTLVKDTTSTDVTKFIIDATGNPMVLPLAGTYKLDKVSYTIGNTKYATSVSSSEAGVVGVPYDANTSAPEYTFAWDAPVVKITGINPTGSVTVNTGSGTWFSAKKTTATNKIINDYECTVHLQATINDRNTVTAYATSKVTTTISNVNTFTSASVLVDGSDSDATFSYTTSATSNSQEIGSYLELFRNWDRYLLGNGATGTHITITGTVGNYTITYVFALDNPITINNPY